MSEVTDMEVKERTSQLTQAPEQQQARPALAPPRVLELGTILTLRKAGHLRSPVPGQEYFAPAVVLEQYMPNGEIDCLVFDSTAGVHFLSAYAIRDVDARTDLATGAREMYEKRSNIGDVLFSPAQFSNISDGMDTLALSYSRLRSSVAQMEDRIKSLEAFAADLKGDKPSVAQVSGAAATATHSKGDQPKG